MQRPELDITEDMNASKFCVVKVTLSWSILPDDAHHFLGFYSRLRTRSRN